jgi:hypothetical protein
MKKRKKEVKKRRAKLPIEHWSHSSLMSFLRNPLAWYKRYVERSTTFPQVPLAL